MPLQVRVLTPDGEVLTQDAAEMVLLPGAEGVLGILPHHAPLLTLLRPGTMRIRANGRAQVMAVSGGLARVQGGEVLVLADEAARAEEIALEPARLAAAQEEHGLQIALKGGDLTAVASTRQTLQRAQAWAEAAAEKQG